jgi:hypothetical protein
MHHAFSHFVRARQIPSAQALIIFARYKSDLYIF